MNDQPASCAMDRAAPPDAPDRRILVVDDSATERRVLRARLERRGYAVAEAADGAEARDRLEREELPLVLSDWMMPGMSGPELCRWLRRERTGDRLPYVYVVLLTARDSQDDIAKGLEAGADDFLSKPVEEGELAARVASGFRVVEMQARLLAQSRALANAYDALGAAHERLERDLEAAAELQRLALPPAHASCNGFAVASAYRPAAHVGGDHVGWFAAGPHGLVAFSIDVSGHGVASALEAVRLAELLRPAPDGAPGGRLALLPGGGLPAPHEIVAELNALTLERERNDFYFTMAVAAIDRATGQGLLCRAGHPEPLILRAGGDVETMTGPGGPPLGLIPYGGFESLSFRLGPRDRLLLHSDGLTEIARPGGGMLETEGLARRLTAAASSATPELLPALIDALTEEAGGHGFEDDVSALLIEAPGGADLSSPAAS